MMGQQSREECLFYSFRLEDQIPEAHLLRLIDRYVDFSFVRDRLKSSYSPTGRPSIDPEVFLRLRGRRVGGGPPPDGGRHDGVCKREPASPRLTRAAGRGRAGL